MGTVPFYSIARVHISDITTQAQSALFIAIFIAVDVVGRAMGYIIAMPILKV